MASQSSNVTSPWHGSVSQSHEMKPQDGDSSSPPIKKLKKDTNLESRLSNILACIVCLGLPPSMVYQCSRGHLMCVSCNNHLLADARLKDEHASCPVCRIGIGQGSCTRNLTAEKTISELPIPCRYCSEIYPRNLVGGHEVNDCYERIVNCKFRPFGCDWEGSFHESMKHEDECTHPCKTPNQILECIQADKQKQSVEISKYKHLVSLLSYDQMSFSDIQLRPMRTDDFVSRLYYETNRFHALGCTWLVKAIISSVENHPKNPTAIAERKLMYQLIMKSKPSFGRSDQPQITEDMDVCSMILTPPFDDMSIKADSAFHKFTNDSPESEYRPIEAEDTNKLLSSKVINLRLFLFYSKV